jgi:hypothetical protein
MFHHILLSHLSENSGDTILNSKDCVASSSTSRDIYGVHLIDTKLEDGARIATLLNHIWRNSTIPRIVQAALIPARVSVGNQLGLFNIYAMVNLHCSPQWTGVKNTAQDCAGTSVHGLI